MILVAALSALKAGVVATSMVTTSSKYPTTRPWKGWYGLARWQERRTYQLSTSPLCVRCLDSEIVEPATVADHVTPHRGDAALFWYGELQSLCASCHSGGKQAEEHGKTVIRFDVNGWPL